jgi:hypothetical protein
MNNLPITCRICGESKMDRHTGPIYKYSVHRYAHARCGILQWGQEWLDRQPIWEISHFPFMLAEELRILDYLRGRLVIQETKGQIQ